MNPIRRGIMQYDEKGNPIAKVLEVAFERLPRTVAWYPFMGDQVLTVVSPQATTMRLLLKLRAQYKGGYYYYDRILLTPAQQIPLTLGDWRADVELIDGPKPVMPDEPLKEIHIDLRVRPQDIWAVDRTLPGDLLKDCHREDVGYLVRRFAPTATSATVRLSLYPKISKEGQVWVKGPCGEQWQVRRGSWLVLGTGTRAVAGEVMNEVTVRNTP